MSAPTAQVSRLHEPPPEPVILDFLGREIHIADDVVYIERLNSGSGFGSYGFQRAIVEAFPPSKPQLVRIRHHAFTERHAVRRPEELVVVF